MLTGRALVKGSVTDARTAEHLASGWTAFVHKASPPIAKRVVQRSPGGHL